MRHGPPVRSRKLFIVTVCVVAAVVVGVLILLYFGHDIHAGNYLNVKSLAVFGSIPVVLVVLGTLLNNSLKKTTYYPQRDGTVGSPAPKSTNEKKKKAHPPEKVSPSSPPPLPPPPLLDGSGRWGYTVPEESGKKKAHPPVTVADQP